MNDLVPSEFSLGQNYPNPFKDKTTIKYCVPQKCRVVLTVLNSDGEIVQQLVDEEKLPGTYEVVFESKKLPSGMYNYKMITESYTETKQMICSNVEKNSFQNDIKEEI